MHKEAAWLLDELNGLVARGVLDEGAAARLRAHYAPAAAAPRFSWGLVLLAIGGAALIGLGIILIFAHNWEQWTPGVRAVLSLLPLLAGQAAALYALRSGSRAWSEAGGLFTAIAIGASIALIAQTYQFGGDLPRFLMTWLLLAAPLIYLLDASVVAVGCWALTLGWALASPHDGWWARADDLQDALRVPTFLALFSIPLPHLVRHLRVDRAGARVAWLLRAGIVVLAIGLGYTVGHREEDVLLLLYGALAAAAALAGQRYFGGVHGLWGNPLKIAGHLGVFIVALALTTRGVINGIDSVHNAFLLLPALLAAGAAWLAWREFQGGDRLLAPLIAALPVLAYALPQMGRDAQGAAVLIGHAYALALVAALIRTGLKQARLGLANEGVALLAALMMLRFFDSDFSYVVRGVGFIVTGAGFFAAVFWLRRRVTRAVA